MKTQVNNLKIKLGPGFMPGTYLSLSEETCKVWAEAEISYFDQVKILKN